MKHETLARLFKKNKILSSQFRWIPGLLVMTTLLTTALGSSASPLLAKPLDYPASRVTPWWQRELAGGWSETASPTVTDVRSDYSGQEIVVGTKMRPGYPYPGSIALLSATGSVIWEKTSYKVGGATYAIGSVWSSAAVGDINNDGDKEIVVGLGGDGAIISRGGVLALDPWGNVEWYYATGDINYPGNGPNGLPDGVRSTPALADLNGDGSVEVVVSGGDNHMHIINGSTGQSLPNWPVDLRDTSYSSAAVADIDNDNQFELAFGAGFGYNDPGNCLYEGGIFRVMRYDATYPPGFDQRLDCNPWFVLVRGKHVDQAIYSSPAIGDINNDGQLEIAVGSGNFLAGKGHWVKVWGADGTLRKTLTTNGYVDSEPALADLNGDGYLDIIAATEQQATVYAWSGKPTDNWVPLWSTKVYMFNGVSGPIFGSPIVADVVLSSAGPEVLVANGAEITVLAADGTQLTSLTGSDGKPTFWLGLSPTAGTPAVADTDNDGNLEIIAAGGYWDPPNWDPANGNPNWKESVFAWRWPGASGNASGASPPWPQFRQNAAHLGRVPVPARLAASPTTIQHRYSYGSGAPTTISGSFSLLNLGDESLSYSLSQVSTIPFAFTSPINGTLGPQASTSVGYILSVASLITGTYPTTVTASATAGGSPADGSPQTIIIEAIVGTFEDVFLPIILKNR
jgi:hypothetical protein